MNLIRLLFHLLWAWRSTLNELVATYNKAQLEQTIDRRQMFRWKILPYWKPEWTDRKIACKHPGKSEEYKIFH